MLILLKLQIGVSKKYLIRNEPSVKINFITLSSVGNEKPLKEHENDAWFKIDLFAPVVRQIKTCKLVPASHQT